MLGKIKSISIILLVLLISAGAVFAGGEKESSESASSAYPEKNRLLYLFLSEQAVQPTLWEERL